MVPASVSSLLQAPLGYSKRDAEGQEIVLSLCTFPNFFFLLGNLIKKPDAADTFSSFFSV